MFRVALTYNTFSSLVNGLLSFAASYVTAIQRWRAQYLMIGSITLAWGCLMMAFLPNSPTSARWLTLRQRVIATQRLAQNRTGVENKVFKGYHVKEAVLDLRTWLVFFINLALAIPSESSARLLRLD